MAKFKRKDEDRCLMVGLDISSTDTGVAVIGVDGELEYHNHFESDKGDYMRLLETAGTIVSVLNTKYGLDYFDALKVFPEQVFMGRNAYAMMTPLIMHGILLCKFNELAHCIGAELYWNEVSVSTWRNWLFKKAGIKPVSKKSKDQKIATMQALMCAYCIDVDNDNEADSIGLALWAQENT